MHKVLGNFVEVTLHLTFLQAISVSHRVFSPSSNLYGLSPSMLEHINVQHIVE